MPPLGAATVFPLFSDALAAALGLSIAARVICVAVTLLMQVAPWTDGPLGVVVDLLEATSTLAAALTVLAVMATALVMMTFVSPYLRWAGQRALTLLRLRRHVLPLATALGDTATARLLAALRGGSRHTLRSDADLIAFLATVIAATAGLGLTGHALLALLTCSAGLALHTWVAYGRRGAATVAGALSGLGFSLFSPLPLGTAALLRRMTSGR